MRPVDQIYVYGNSERAYLLAVVVPTAAGRTTGIAISPRRSSGRSRTLRPGHGLNPMRSPGT